MAEKLVDKGEAFVTSMEGKYNAVFPGAPKGVKSVAYAQPMVGWMNVRCPTAKTARGFKAFVADILWRRRLHHPLHSTEPNMRQLSEGN